MDVRIENVEKGFGSVRVLKSVDLHFPSRAFVTLLGPSGCGKTTLLRMIAGLESVDRGSIRFGGRVVNGLAPRDRNIAMVFQSYALYPQMTVRQNIGYGLKVAGIDRSTRDLAVTKVAQTLEIESLLDRKPGQLSGGQRQRVALGRAMVRQPDIFLMDEPLSNLDAKLRMTMRSELRRFHLALGATTIYVTHDQLEAMTMSDYVAVMNGGVVQQFGTPAEVYQKPANLFVASFIGSPPMNFLSGQLVTEEGRRSVRIAGGTASVPVQSTGTGGGDIELAFRPQKGRLVAATGSGLAGRATNSELIGSEKLIELTLPDAQRIVVQVDSETDVQLGHAYGVEVAPADVHLFDKASGDRLS